MTKRWIKTPYPGETVGEGVWHECTTWYEREVLWRKHFHSKAKWALPTHEGEEPPCD